MRTYQKKNPEIPFTSSGQTAKIYLHQTLPRNAHIGRVHVSRSQDIFVVKTTAVVIEEEKVESYYNIGIPDRIRDKDIIIDSLGSNCSFIDTKNVTGICKVVSLEGIRYITVSDDQGCKDSVMHFWKVDIKTLRVLRTQGYDICCILNNSLVELVLTNKLEEKEEYELS